ncbi:MAG: hypothetical protein M1837_006671 [Sclerophora amabilis]|nr:MAG: hypothetical protein M1837_006671 [Sclerophora amabilis]
MDLLASIRKEGSRGGRDNFKWSDVAADTHRENYLGHSLMAPVGRWQKNRDLGWYANSSTDAAGTPGNNPQEMARLAEIAKIKEAENEALAEALGFPVVSANQTKLGGGAGAPTGASEGEVRRAVQEAGIGDHDGYDPDRDERSAGVGLTDNGEFPSVSVLLLSQLACHPVRADEGAIPEECRALRKADVLIFVRRPDARSTQDERNKLQALEPTLHLTLETVTDNSTTNHPELSVCPVREDGSADEGR